MYIPRRVKLARIMSPLLSLDGCNLRRSTVSVGRSNFVRDLHRLAGFRELSTAAELRKRLGEELKYESENDAAKPDSQYIEDYTSKSSWKIEEVFGSKYVKFIKNRGKNKISVIVDVSAVGEENDDKIYPEDEYDDRENDGNDDVESDAESDAMGVTAIVEDIHKPTKGALKLDLLIQDDEFSIQQVEHFNDAKQAHNLAMAKSVELSTQYAGPHFYTLDDDLQKLYREYLVDLSLDSDFARFVYSYAMAKEYKEYLDWLKRTREFFEE